MTGCLCVSVPSLEREADSFTHACNLVDGLVSFAVLS